jgi:ferredoxin
MDVQIDDSLCQGTGYCVRVAPTVFEVVDGVAVLKTDVNIDEFEDETQEAESLCPTRAIRFGPPEVH